MTAESKNKVDQILNDPVVKACKKKFYLDGNGRNSYNKLTGILEFDDGTTILLNKEETDNSEKENVLRYRKIIDNSGFHEFNRDFDTRTIETIDHYDTGAETRELNELVSNIENVSSLKEIDESGTGNEMKEKQDRCIELLNKYVIEKYGLIKRIFIGPDWLIFERIVLNEISKISDKLRLDTVYQYKEKYLSEIPGNLEMSIRPDVVVKENNIVKNIFDAKDKTMDKNNKYQDIRQISEYVHAMGNKPGFLVYPDDLNKDWKNTPYWNYEKNIGFIKMSRTEPEKSDQNITDILNGKL